MGRLRTWLAVADERGRRLLVAGVLCAVAAGSAGCAGGLSDAASAPVDRDRSSPSGTPEPHSGPESPASPGSPAAVGPTPVPAPSAVPKIRRPGQPVRPTVTAEPASFRAPVRYPDGINVTVGAAVVGVETGQGAGQFAGRELALLPITLVNGSRRAVDLQQVVVSASYGPDNLAAERVYAADLDARDFGGTLAPGARAQARYAFAVPSGELDDVRLVVDFDGLHTSAEFRGPVEVRR